MKKLLRILKNTFDISIIYFILQASVIATCNKEDINYYLEKGFTTEQVTALCSQNIKANNKIDEIYKSFGDEYADEKDEEYIKKMRVERQVFFKSALQVENIVIKSDELQFTKHECAKEGMANSGSDANKSGCAQVLVTIKLSEVDVEEEEFRERIFFGTKLINIKGNITQKIVGGLDGLSEFDRNVLKKKIYTRLNEKSKQTYVPIRAGLSFQYALETFKEIVSFHKGLAKNQVPRNNLGGSLEFDEINKVINDQDDYIFSKKKEGISFSNTKDESIDGTFVFDDLPNPSNKNEKNNNEIPDSVFN